MCTSLFLSFVLALATNVVVVVVVVVVRWLAGKAEQSAAPVEEVQDRGRRRVREVDADSALRQAGRERSRRPGVQRRQHEQSADSLAAATCPRATGGSSANNTSFLTHPQNINWRRCRRLDQQDRDIQAARACRHRRVGHGRRLLARQEQQARAQIGRIAAD